MYIFAMPLLLMTPCIAFADFGLPMLALAWPLFTVAIVPIVALESWVVKRALNISWRSAVTNLTKANIYSTLVGIPVAWIASVIFQISIQEIITGLFDSQGYPPDFMNKFGKVLFTPAWLGPWRGGQPAWVVSVPLSILLVPFFFASYWLEARYVAYMLCPNEPALARKAIWKANVISYLAIFGSVVLLSLYALWNGH